MINILLMEDNPGISEGLVFSLENTGYKVCLADSVEKARHIIINEKIDIALLDVAMPDGNGFEFYREMIDGKGIFAIFITARDDEDDVCLGFDMGAEDYITKPFSTKELLARVKRVALRINKDSVIKAGDIVYDAWKMEVKRNGEIVVLSSLELKILHHLFTNHDRAVKRGELIDLIWESTGNDVYDHTVTVYLKRIREKLGEDIISTIKGVGYRIDTK